MAFELNYDAKKTDSKSSITTAVTAAVVVMENDAKVNTVIISSVTKPDYNVIVVRN